MSSLIFLVTMEPNSSASIRLAVFAIVVAITLIALIADKIVIAHRRPEAVHTVRVEGAIDRASATTNAKNIYSNNNVAYFTSMEAEFEWNQMMVPDYDPGNIVIDQSIQKDHDTGRLLEDNGNRYGSLRGNSD